MPQKPNMHRETPPFEFHDESKTLAYKPGVKRTTPPMSQPGNEVRAGHTIQKNSGKMDGDGTSNWTGH